MAKSNVSRGALALEWTVCFGFLALWGIVEIIDIPGLINGNLEQTLTYLSNRGPFNAAVGALELLISALGLYGLVLGVRFGTEGRAIRSKNLAAGIAGTLLIFGLADAAYHAWSAGTVRMPYEWRGLILLSVLPAIGFLHIHRLSGRGEPHDATPAKAC